MRTEKIILSSIVGTSAMTVFSHLVSESENKNFSEPKVIGQLIKRLLIRSISTNQAKIAGWILHYSIGFLFVAFYNELWKRKKIKPSLTSGALIGASSGLAGIAGWKCMFVVHPNPPAKNLKQFFGHLMLAHIVFGIFSTLVAKRNF